MSQDLEILGFDEIIGTDYLAGDSLDSLLGAQLVGADMAVPNINANSQAARYALAMKAAQGKTLVQTRGPTKSRRYPIGFDSGATLVLAGAAATIAVQPQVPFRGTRLSVAAASAASFVITDIKVGKNSQLAATGNLPAESFSELAQDMGMSFDTCQTSQQIQILVTNIALAPARFLATLVGDAVE